MSALQGPPPPGGWHERIAALLLRGLLRLALKPVFSPRVPIAWQRRWLHGLSALSLPLRGARHDPAEVGGVPGDPRRCGNGVVDGRRELVFGRQAVVDRHDCTARAIGEMAAHAVMGVEIAHHPAAPRTIDEGRQPRGWGTHRHVVAQLDRTARSLRR